VSICKHLLAVRKLVDEEFTYLDVPQIEVRLAKLNDLYVELGREFFNTDKMKP